MKKGRSCPGVNIAKPRSETIIKTVIDGKKCDILKFKKEIKEAPWHTSNIFDDIDDNYWMMESIYRNIAESSLPKRKAKIRMNSLPWIDSRIRKLMNQRYKQLKKYRHTEDRTEKDRYKQLRNNVNKELRIAEEKHWKNLLEDCDKQGSNFWKIIKQITFKDQKQKRIGPIKKMSKSWFMMILKSQRP